MQRVGPGQRADFRDDPGRGVAPSLRSDRLGLDVGEGRTRNVFSGIASAYKPQDLVGKLTGAKVAANDARQAVKAVLHG